VDLSVFFLFSSAAFASVSTVSSVILLLSFIALAFAFSSPFSTLLLLFALVIATAQPPLQKEPQRKRP
jgi:hypothetical protein